MIKVSVLYPATETGRFDMDYYTSKHIPMVGSLLGTKLLRVEVDQGLAGGVPGARAPFAAIAHMYFSSVEEFQVAFGPHAAQLTADVPNYTNVEPVIQISQLLVGGT